VREDKLRANISIFRVAFRKHIMLGNSLALVFLEILQLFTKNELEVNKTKQSSLKTGALSVTERGNALMLYLSKHSIRRSEKRRISKGRALVRFGGQ